MNPISVKVNNLSFSYADVQALANVNLSFEPGKVHALLGENGAGKSSLFSLLFGILKTDKGSLEVIDTENNSRKLGFDDVGLVPQHSSLLKELSVIENFALQTKSLGKINWEKLEQEVIQCLKEFDVSCDQNTLVANLDASTSQCIEIARVVWSGKQVVLLDEPSALLAADATYKLFQTIKRLADKNHTVIFSSHRLEEVMDVASDLHVLRHGQVTLSSPCEEVNEEQLFQAIYGNTKEAFNSAIENNEKVTTSNKAMLKISNVELFKDSKHSINLEVKQGEIVVIIGGAGNGQTQLMDVLCGFTKPIKGNVLLDGKPTKINQVKAQGLGRLPLELNASAAASLSVAENLVIHDYIKPTYSKNFFKLLDWNAINKHANKTIASEQLSIKNGKSIFSWLSGGNQRKALIARELADNPKAFVAHNIEAGLDAQNLNEQAKRLVNAKQKGTAILLFAEDINFANKVADQIFEIKDSQLLDLNK